MRLCTAQESPYLIHPSVQGDTISQVCQYQTAFVGGTTFATSGLTCTVQNIGGSTRSASYQVVNHCLEYVPETDGINWYDTTVLLQACLVAACVLMLVMGFRMGDRV